MAQPLSSKPEDVAAARIVGLLGDSSFSPSGMLKQAEVANLISAAFMGERSDHAKEVKELRARLKVFEG